jgi:hypothetical protein
MATFMEILSASFFLIINTVILIVVTVTVGPIIDWLAVWLPNQPVGLLDYTPIQLTFGAFYGMICVIELGLFVQLFLVPIIRTDYNTGEEDF